MRCGGLQHGVLLKNIATATLFMAEQRRDKGWKVRGVTSPRQQPWGQEVWGPMTQERSQLLCILLGQL